MPPTDPDLIIRAEAPEDREAVHALHSAAFGRPSEADLVDALRGERPHLSLVAVLEGRVVGHVLFSPVTIEPEPAVAAGGLAPVAVDEAYRRRGIAEALIRHGLARCTTLGWQAVFVVGDPAYYRRFGFQLCAPALRYEGEAFDEAVQALELRQGALDGVKGFVRYPPAFDQV